MDIVELSEVCARVVVELAWVAIAIAIAIMD